MKETRKYWEMQRDKRKPSAKTSWIKCRIPPAQKTRYVKAAQARGLSLTQFMYEAMDEKIARGE